MAETFDYRDLLLRYMAHVYDQEGTTFLTLHFSGRTDFSEAEKHELQGLGTAAEAMIDGPK